MGKKKQYKIKAVESFTDSKQDYFNRELSWVKFNERVLNEAQNPDNPLMERVGFLAIVGDNLDEFFRVRVPPYQNSKKDMVNEFTSLARSVEQLDIVYFSTIDMLRRASKLWRTELVPEMKKEGISIVEWADLSNSEKEAFRHLMDEQTFTVVRKNPNVSVGSDEFHSGLAFGVIVNSSAALVPVQDIIDKVGRILPVGKDGTRFIFIEEIMVNYIEKLFLGEEVYLITPLRLTRDADLDLQGDDAEDLYEALQKAKQELPHRQASRLEVLENIPYGYIAKTAELFKLPPTLIYDYKAPLGIADIRQISVNRSDLYFPTFVPPTPEGLEKEGLFDSIAEKDRLQFTPYQSFNGLLNFLNAAAEDANVTEIKMTLYRLGSKSPVVDALLSAAKRGVKVTAVIELKASFDEERNFHWTDELRKGGVTVIHGPAQLKTHGKCCLVTRREGRKTVNYATVSTGNYNARTAAIYSDFSLFTADKKITSDLVTLFEMLEKSETKAKFSHLLISPEYLEKSMLSLIRKEISISKEGGRGHIIMKMNSLTDKVIINALYAASKAGVKVDLLIRGVCMLRPGVPGLSDNITVSSTVGRFLEHARVFYFANGNDPKIYIGSPDMMPRNLRKRVEIVCPVYDKEIRKTLTDVLRTYMEDKGGAYHLDALGRYSVPKEGKKRAQELFIEQFGQKSL
ncbi:MAG TPA: polyphosphate kinase 1 [Methanocorpusculum sp.]|nr:polyphosphate kinase 1 [Methanocorpusculum sp.]